MVVLDADVTVAVWLLLLWAAVRDSLRRDMRRDDMDGDGVGGREIKCPNAAQRNGTQGTMRKRNEHTAPQTRVDTRGDESGGVRRRARSPLCPVHRALHRLICSPQIATLVSHFVYECASEIAPQERGAVGRRTNDDNGPRHRRCR